MVDDKVENRDQIRRSLEGLDIALIEINSFEDFFTRYLPGSKLPEILILDYFLEKGKTGKGLYIQMKSNFSESYKNVTVIGFSSIENCSKAIAVES